MLVAVVASNPSHLGPNSPAKRVFYTWVPKLGIEHCYAFMNVSDQVTPNNRPLKTSEFQLERLRYDLQDCTVAIALGKTAAKALKKLNVPHFELPHPSPRNRKLNDKELIKRLLDECKQFLSEKQC